MLDKQQILDVIQTEISLVRWLDSSTESRTNKITDLRIALTGARIVDNFIDTNNSRDLLKLMSQIFVHLSKIDGKDDGYSKRQCLKAIIYAVNNHKYEIFDKLVQFFNSKFSATQKDIDYLNMKLNFNSQTSFNLIDDTNTLVFSKQTTAKTQVFFDPHLIQASIKLSNDKTNPLLLKEAVAIAAITRQSRKDIIPKRANTNGFWNNLNPITKCLTTALIPAGIVAAIGATTLGIMSIYAKHLIANLNTHLLLGSWPTFGIIVASIFLAALIADLLVGRLMEYHQSQLKPL